MVFTSTKTDGLTEFQSKKVYSVHQTQEAKKIMPCYLHNSGNLFFGQLQGHFVMSRDL